MIGYLRGRFRPLREASTNPPVEQILANLEWIARSLTSARDFGGCAFLNVLAELGSEDSEARGLADWPLLTRRVGCGTVTCCLDRRRWPRYFGDAVGAARRWAPYAAVLIHQDPAMKRPAIAATRTLLKVAGVAISTGEAKSVAIGQAPRWCISAPALHVSSRQVI